MRSGQPAQHGSRGKAKSADQWASRRELLGLGAYFVFLVGVTDALNIRLGIELMSLAVLVPPLATQRFWAFLRDWWPLLAGLFLWTLSGAVAAHTPITPHLGPLLSADRSMFLGHQPVELLQHAFLTPGHPGPLDWVAAGSYNLHLAEPFLAGYFLWRLDRTLFVRFAASVNLLLLTGYICYIVYPAVPPWMASGTFHRLHHVINGFGAVLHAHPLALHGTPIFYLFRWHGDAVAAFPSEHAALPLLELLAFRLFRRPVVTGLFAAWVVWILFVVVYLGEHWVVDVLAGWLLALGVWIAVGRLTGPRPSSLAPAAPAGTTPAAARLPSPPSR